MLRKPVQAQLRSPAEELPEGFTTSSALWGGLMFVSQTHKVVCPKP